MNRILNWFRLRRLEGDLDRELQYHIDRRVTDLIHSGLPEPEARRRVALELGGATQVREEVRDIWLTRWLRDFVYDLRFSARSVTIVAAALILCSTALSAALIPDRRASIRVDGERRRAFTPAGKEVCRPRIFRSAAGLRWKTRSRGRCAARHC